MRLSSGERQRLSDTELLSSGLGVLINLAEGAAPLRARLAAAPVALPASGSNQGGSSSGDDRGGSGDVGRLADDSAAEQPATLVALLCRLVSHTAQRTTSPRCVPFEVVNVCMAATA